MHEPVQRPGGRKSGGSEPQRLTRALAQDLRASVQGLRMSLDLINGAMMPCNIRCAERFVGMAQNEVAQLDRLVEQLSLWVRLLGGDYKVRPQRVDLVAVLTERLQPWSTLPAHSVPVMADKGLLVPAAEGLADFLRAYVQHQEQAGVTVTEDGRIAVYGPHTLLPVLQTVANSPVPDLQAAGGPAMWLVGPSLAVASCRACGGEVWLEDDEEQCTLYLSWPKAV